MLKTKQEEFETESRHTPQRCTDSRQWQKSIHFNTSVHPYTDECTSVCTKSVSGRIMGTWQHGVAVAQGWSQCPVIWRSLIWFPWSACQSVLGQDLMCWWALWIAATTSVWMYVWITVCHFGQKRLIYDLNVNVSKVYYKSLLSYVKKEAVVMKSSQQWWRFIKETVTD